MKNEFQKLGIQLKEIASLLFVPETTLYSWFDRKSNIPSACYGYISGLRMYQAKHEKEDLKAIYTKWETTNRALLATQKTNALRGLRLNEQKNDLALGQLQQKETRLLRRLHLSEHYPKYLGADLQNTENLLSWCSLMFRSSAFDLGDTRACYSKIRRKKSGISRSNSILGRYVGLVIFRLTTKIKMENT